MSSNRISRRSALKIGLAGATLPLVNVRTASSAGRLSVGFSDHFVPAGNEVIQSQVNAWAQKNNVEVSLDFIPSAGGKNIITIAAEAQAKTGHDILSMPTWQVHNNAPLLEPVDDVMDNLIGKYGPTTEVAEYMGKVEGTWRAVPTSPANANKGAHARISVMKSIGFDVTKVFPAAGESPSLPDDWTYEKFIEIAEACKNANMPMALPLGQTSDAVDWVGALFAAFGAELVDKYGNITVDSPAVREVLEYSTRLVKHLPPEAPSFDDASNNRAFVSGTSALIFNPPSAWAVAKRDAPEIAADTWCFPSPTGPKGRFVASLPYFWGIWSFSSNKPAAKDLLTFMMEREQVEERCTAVEGYDLPPFKNMTDFPIWSVAGPPVGVVYNYPVRPSHNAVTHIAAAPAPARFAVQIYTRGTMPTMIARLMAGESIDDVVAWAGSELEGFDR